MFYETSHLASQDHATHNFEALLHFIQSSLILYITSASFPPSFPMIKPKYLKQALPNQSSRVTSVLSLLLILLHCLYSRFVPISIYSISSCRKKGISSQINYLTQRVNEVPNQRIPQLLSVKLMRHQTQISNFECPSLICSMKDSMRTGSNGLE